MNEFDRSGKLVVARAAVSDQLCTREREHGAQAFASPGNQVSCECGDERNLALHPVEDDLVYLVHARGSQFEHGLDRGLGALARQGYDFGSHCSLAMSCLSFLGKGAFAANLTIHDAGRATIR